MKELELKLTGVKALGETLVNIDDKPVEVKMNEFGNATCKYVTENDKINIKVYRMLDVGGFGWFVTQLFFFLISIFGLFDIHRKEKCLVVDYEAEVELKEECELNLSLSSPQENARAIKAETDLKINEVSNKYFYDVKAKKTLKWLKISKLLLALAVVALSIALLMISF